MKYHMRRSEREITDWAVMEDILNKGKYATIGLCRRNEPYIVTLSYGYESTARSLYFHCAKHGLKSEFLAENPVVAATVIQDLGYIQSKCKQRYRSVVIRGEIEILTIEAEKQKGIDILLNHLEENPDIVRAAACHTPEQFRDVQIWRLKIGEITGKEGE